MYTLGKKKSLKNAIKFNRKNHYPEFVKYPYEYSTAVHQVNANAAVAVFYYYKF
jgi:hypothetical protein